MLKILLFAVLSQAIGALTGFLLARWLDVEDYAIYTLIGVVTGAMAILTKGGIHLGLNAILGRTWPDRPRAAQAIRVALLQRWKLSAFLLPLLLVVAGLLLHRNHAGPGLIIVLLLLLLATWYFDMQSRVVDQVLLFANRATLLQALDTSLSVSRLLLSWLIFVLGLQGALAATIVNVLAAGARIPFVRRWVRQEIPASTAIVDQEDGRFIRAIVKRQLPLDAFYCVQSQLTFAIVAYYGVTSQTASLGALSRIAQLLMPVTVVAGSYAIPRFAQARDALLSRFGGWVLLASLPACGLVTLSLVWPGAVLWLVGPNYASLTSELVIACLSAGAYSVASIAWELLANRGLNHFAFVQVPVVLVWCLVAPHFLNLSTLSGVLWLEFGLASGLMAAVLCEIIGAVRAGRLLPAEEGFAVSPGPP
jgi:O-antigen/teichoic acid export membrane protein